jgi:dienelactone hydrolase
MRQNGFAVLVLDNYSARGLTGGKACVQPPSREFIEVMVDDAFNTIKVLQAHRKIDRLNMFLVGQSLGGAAALKVARSQDTRHVGAFRAVAAYYPGQCQLLGFGLQLRSALMVFGAGRDDWTPVAGCESAKKLVDPSKGPAYDVVVYADALHAFDQPRETYRYKGHLLGYNPKATADSRQRMVEFFKRHLETKERAK